ncbi:MAG: methyltransferase domain-containing protein [Thermomicrobiales bacterium]
MTAEQSSTNRDEPGEVKRGLAPPVVVDHARVESDRAIWLARSRAAWDARAERWDVHASANAVALDRLAELNRIWDVLRLRPGARILDAGCGTGQVAIALAARGARVTGIDLSPEMIRRAETHAAAHGVTIEWRNADISRIEEPFAVYDAILARVVLQFVPDIPSVLREFRRVLRPAGRLLASVPGALSPIYRASWMRHLPGGDPGNNYLLPWELEALLIEHGWRVLDGWPDWGEDLYGAANVAGASLRDAPAPLQQAAATTWTTIAG